MGPICLTWIILAGGKSRRMGQAKHLLPWKSGTLLDAAAAKAGAMDAKQILVSSSASLPPYHCCKDVYPNIGPLGGIHTCLREAEREMCMVIPVDVPLFPESLVPEMAEYAASRGFDYLPLTWNGTLEPIAAIVRRSALNPIEQMIRQGDYQVRRLSLYTHSGVFSRAGDPLLLQNCNTPEQYANLYRQFGMG